MIETGIYFDDLHSYHDFGLVLSAVDIPAATPKTNYVDIPGGDGSVDLTEALGDVKYNDRECTFTFTAGKSINESEWEELKTKVNNALNGKTFKKITLEKDPDYFYSGRCSINGYAINKRLRQIIVNARVAPWKFKQAKTIITAEVDTDLDHPISMYLPNSRRSVFPEVSISGTDFTIGSDEGEFHYTDGTYTVKNHYFRLKEGITKVLVSGHGTISFSYQEGDL